MTKEAWKKAKAENNQALAVEIEADAIGRCVACAEPVFDGEPFHMGADEIQCAECAPTYADMIRDPEYFVSFKTGEPMTPAEAQAAVDKHLASGGSLEDKMVSA